MRARLVLAGALVALAGAPPAAPTNACGRTIVHGPRLPAAILLDTGCGTYRIGRDGRISPARPLDSVPAWAHGALGHPDRRTWVAHENRRLQVYRAGRLLWRSHSTGGSDEVAIGHGRIAFTSYSRGEQPKVWLARLGGGREREVGPGEMIVGWTRAGLVTQHSFDLRLRADDGRLVRRLGLARGAFLDRTRGDIVLLTRGGRVVRTDGVRDRTVADLHDLGFARQAWLSLLPSGLMQVTSGNRVLFLQPDGRRFASAAFAQTTKSRLGGVIVSEVVPLRGRDAVLFAVSRRAMHGLGTESVFRLDRGHRVPRLLFAARDQWATCGEWATLSLRRGGVLYASSEGSLAILDPIGGRSPIDLTALARRLSPGRPTPDDHLNAYWAP
jgi:hypothetical protein